MKLGLLSSRHYPHRSRFPIMPSGRHRNSCVLLVGRQLTMQRGLQSCPFCGWPIWVTVFQLKSFQSLLCCHKKSIRKSKHMPKILFLRENSSKTSARLYSLCIQGTVVYLPWDTIVISVIWQVFLVFLWAHSHSLEIRNGRVIYFGRWNMNGNVMHLTEVKVLRAVCLATFPLPCFL